ncbi:39S ribosomal protein L22, mitochondrial [Madurella fahalii]|uniref:39S ribosomal protein L22, mitochondrial n=1 Tax=Madurella fahalii TaxID=1157608 RepID=A0ABQ0GPR7_9PEZI
MTLSVPSRRLLRGAPPSANALLPALQSLSLAPNTTTTRPIHTTPSNQWFWNRKSRDQTETSIEKQVSGTQETRNALVNRLSSRLEGPAIFEDEAKETAPVGGPDATQQPGRKSGAFTRAGASLVKEHLARAVDPDPRSRVRWERKMVIRQVQRGTNPFSREPRAARIARTERQLTTKSPFLATSVKKLVHLARQIQGKTVAEALVQMRYSKKKMAQEVGYQLELARDLAVAERGMGLGEARTAAAVANGEEVEATQPVKIQTKDGKWVTIEDPTRMYVAEAWVNRGPWRGTVPDYRARGRMYLKMKPSTSISIVLKEEKTRLREHEERQAKKMRQGPWIHLPDRPVTAQRQYYSW